MESSNSLSVFHLETVQRGVTLELPEKNGCAYWEVKPQLNHAQAIFAYNSLKQHPEQDKHIESVCIVIIMEEACNPNIGIEDISKL
jgi:hypothetical protein